jgi:hypothetical protein
LLRRETAVRPAGAGFEKFTSPLLTYLGFNVTQQPTTTKF